MSEKLDIACTIEERALGWHAVLYVNEKPFLVSSPYPTFDAATKAADFAFGVIQERAAATGCKLTLQIQHGRPLS